MMASAYDEWAGEKRNANEAILREIGLDPVTLVGMSHQEIRAQLKTIEARPSPKRQAAPSDARSPPPSGTWSPTSLRGSFPQNESLN